METPQNGGRLVAKTVPKPTRWKQLKHTHTQPMVKHMETVSSTGSVKWPPSWASASTWPRKKSKKRHTSGWCFAFQLGSTSKETDVLSNTGPTLGGAKTSSG